MDNLGRAPGRGVRERLDAAGATLLYLPPYSPDFNPIELWFAKLKGFLRTARRRIVEESGRQSRRAWPHSRPPNAATISYSLF